MIITPIIVPTYSLSQMLEIINNESKLSAFNTEHIYEMLYALQHEDLTRIKDVNGNPLLRCNPGIIAPVINKDDMEKIIRLEELLINELKARGVNPQKNKFLR